VHRHENELIQSNSNEGWYQSTNIDTIHQGKSQDHRTQMIRINKLWFDSSMIRIKIFMKRFIFTRPTKTKTKELKWYESTHSESIHRDGKKEFCHKMKLDTQDTLKNPMNIGMLGARTYANHYRRNNKHHQNI